MAKLILAGLLLAAGLLALPPGAQAETNYWLGVDTTYSSWVNWSDETHIPGAGDEAVFQDAAVRHTVDTPSGGLTVGTFRFWEDIVTPYTINVNGDLYFDGAGAVTSDSGKAQFNINAGTTTFSSGTSANQAQLIVDGGTLAAGSDSAWGTGTVYVNSGGLRAASGTSPTVGNQIILGGNCSLSGDSDLTLSGEFNLGNTVRTLDVSNTGTTTLSGTVTSSNAASSGIIKTGSGTLVLSGNNDYGAGTAINGGILVAGSDSALGTGGISMNYGILQAGGTGDRTLTNSVTLNEKSFLNGVTTNGLTLTGGITLNDYDLNVMGDGNITLSGLIWGTGGLYIFPFYGTLTVSGEENSYFGDTLLGGGTLVAASDSALGFSNLNMVGGTLQAGGTGDRTLTNGVTLNADSSINGVASNGLTLTGENYNSGINLNSYTLLVKGAGNVTLAGLVSGTGGITMNSTGTLTLSMANNPYTGDTVVNFGTLASGANNAIGQAGTTYLATGAKVNLGGYNQTFTTLNGGGELSGTGVMTIGAGDFGGAISGTGGRVVKDTTGTLTLSGESTYTGGTTITAGTLVAANDDALGSGAVKVGGSATDVATLNMTSNLAAGDFTLNQMAILQAAAGKTLTLSGSFYNYSQAEANWPSPNGFNLTMSGSTFEVAGYDYGVAAAGFTSNFNLDTLTVTGNLVLVDEVNNGNRGGVHGDQEALYVNFLTGDPGATLDLSDLWLYVFNDGDYFALANGVYNNITVTGSPVPLPGGILLLGSGLMGLGLLRLRGRG